MSMQRIIMHWSAGSYTFSEADREHYHYAVDGNGTIHDGEHTVADNESTADDDYAAHTKNLNTGSIGVAICAMANAVESPFNAGSYPIKPDQLDVFLRFVAELAQQYSIPVTRNTILSHAEVQPTLGVTQDGKWDIAWIPGMSKPDNPVKVGDELRQRILAFMQEPAPQPSGDLEARVAWLESWASSFSKQSGV